MPQYDPAVRRRARRNTKRERGAWIYVPAEELERAGGYAGEEPPFYRLFPGRKGSVLVQLYREP